MPPQLSLYISMQPEEKINYSIAGPAGPSKFEAGVAGFETSAFRGLGVVRAMPFETSDESDAVQMLQRQTQIGEYYVVGAPEYPPTNGVKTDYDTVIYDEDTDSLKRISFLKLVEWWCQAIETQLGSGDYKDSYPYLLALMGVEQEGTALTVADLKAGLGDRAGKLLHDKIEAAPKTTIDAKFNDYDKLVTEVEKGTYVPLKIVVARPFIEHLTMSAVISVAGSDTGATLFGPSGALGRPTLCTSHVSACNLTRGGCTLSDMQLSANTSTKVIEG